MSRMKPVYVAVEPRIRVIAISTGKRRAVRALRLELDALVEDPVGAAVEQPAQPAPVRGARAPAG